MGLGGTHLYGHGAELQLVVDEGLRLQQTWGGGEEGGTKQPSTNAGPATSETQGGSNSGEVETSHHFS